jgi:hypothetical protein
MSSITPPLLALLTVRRQFFLPRSSIGLAKPGFDGLPPCPHAGLRKPNAWRGQIPACASATVKRFTHMSLQRICMIAATNTRIHIQALVSVQAFRALRRKVLACEQNSFAPALCPGRAPARKRFQSAKGRAFISGHCVWGRGSVPKPRGTGRQRIVVSGPRPQDIVSSTPDRQKILCSTGLRVYTCGTAHATVQRAGDG